MGNYILKMLSDRPRDGIKWFTWSYASSMSLALWMSGGKPKKFNPTFLMCWLCVLFGFLQETLLGRDDLCFFQGIVKWFAKCWGFVHEFFLWVDLVDLSDWKIQGVADKCRQVLIAGSFSVPNSSGRLIGFWCWEIFCRLLLLCLLKPALTPVLPKGRVNFIAFESNRK